MKNIKYTAGLLACVQRSLNRKMYSRASLSNMLSKWNVKFKKKMHYLRKQAI